ncbi:MAG: hypothetical protein KA419_02995 [Acidobacteria bacterium]|nr:hypothetical protein [Acidobacteriota bacterium]
MRLRSSVGLVLLAGCFSWLSGMAAPGAPATSPPGPPAGAFLAVPDGKLWVEKAGEGPAGVLFMHWGQGDRTEFLSEAAVYARAGAVSLCLDAPWGRPDPWRQIGEDVTQPERTRAMYVQTVIDLRRAVDVLLAEGVDPARIAFVGHSFGATWGGSLAGVEKRIRTCVLMGGLPNVADFSASGAPKWDALKARMTALVAAPLREAYARAVGPVSAVNLVGLAPPSSVFFQFGTQDSYIPRQAALDYVAAAKEPKRVGWYPCSHEFLDLEATRDRLSWLAAELGLKLPPPVPATQGRRK